MTTVGDYFDATQFQGINEGVGNPGIVTSLEGTPADGSYENLQGAIGPDGPQGEPGTPFRWQGDVADRAALDALIPLLNKAMFGFTFRVLSDNSVMFWTGTKFIQFTDAFGGLGQTGQVNTLTIGTVTTGAVGSPLVVSITGTPPSQTLNLTVPRGGTGQKGLTGPPGPIRNSTDYDNTITHTNGMIPLWNTSTSKWTPTEWPGHRGPWSVLEAQSWDNPSSGFVADLTNVSTNPNTIATINIPALPIRWRPYITGGATIYSVPTDWSTRVDLEVRIGSAAGDIVARGVSSAVYIEWFARLRPYFASTLTPGSTTGTIAPNTATTLYVVIRRNLGTGNYSYRRAGANITVWAHPVESP
ncbi:hypothetical protein [Nocardia asiatica]|uniref:hypothetical protein n=1 Tax=Nocardia asiatica TaxID=209252 RepID=UPI0002FFD8BF|nr:hypothetical protein [Nocardia asiatica]